VVGNISYIYPPKYYLGQRVGVKCHEDVIDALGIVVSHRSDVIGVLAGGTWGKDSRYEQSLRLRARRVAGDRIRMPGYLPYEQITRSWPDFDCAVHVPLSENCGGVLEPLLAGVPVIAGRVGGLPELVIEGATGKTVPIRKPTELAAAILEVLTRRDHYRQLSVSGRKLATIMFDVRRTAAEVHEIYHHIINGSRPRPCQFDSLRLAGSLSNDSGRPAQLAPLGRI
jgi:glycosyltransferase involved in cell wall biosynthesis